MIDCVLRRDRQVTPYGDEEVTYVNLATSEDKLADIPADMRETVAADIVNGRRLKVVEQWELDLGRIGEMDMLGVKLFATVNACRRM
jgi:hypothetical protein